MMSEGVAPAVDVETVRGAITYAMFSATHDVDYLDELRVGQTLHDVLPLADIPDGADDGVWVLMKRGSFHMVQRLRSDDRSVIDLVVRGFIRKYGKGIAAHPEDAS